MYWSLQINFFFPQNQKPKFSNVKCNLNSSRDAVFDTRCYKHINTRQRWTSPVPQKEISRLIRHTKDKRNIWNNELSLQPWLDIKHSETQGHSMALGLRRWPWTEIYPGFDSDRDVYFLSFPRLSLSSFSFNKSIKSWREKIDFHVSFCC